MDYYTNWRELKIISCGLLNELTITALNFAVITHIKNKWVCV
jgi:hypothetical protein